MEIAANPKCPQCGSRRLYRDGLRYLRDHSQVQRWLCRNCGYRFSENSLNKRFAEYRSDAHQKAVLMEAQRRFSQLESGQAGATKDVKSKLLEFAWHLKKQNRSLSTIKTYVSMLRKLVNYGCVLSEPETVREVLASINRSEGWKKQAVQSYTAYLEMKGLKWNPPTFKVVHKMPFIPTEAELDQLISGCGSKTSTFLQLLKETAMRCGEALRLLWKDVDLERRLVTLNLPEKNGFPRMFKISEKLASMLGRLPKKSEKVFNCTSQSLQSCFKRSRKRLAVKLGNPRLLHITFHTFRHWKATMEYHKTKDLLHVKEMLGHRKVDNTMLYIQIEKTLFNDENDEFTVKVTDKPEEIKALLEVGFEYVCSKDGQMFFRKRK